MRVVIQRVSHANVAINNTIRSSITKGLLILVGIEDADTVEDIGWLCGKIVNLRIFNDAQGVMNESIKDQDGIYLSLASSPCMPPPKKETGLLISKPANHRWPYRYMNNLCSNCKPSWANPCSPANLALICK